MRYLLLLLGFPCLLFGGLFVLSVKPELAIGGGALMVAGAVLLAIGGATCDIVDAIKGSTGPQER